MTYNNQFTANRYWSLPINVDSDHLAGIVPDDRVDHHLSIIVKSSDSQTQNDLTLIAATSWQIGDAIRISPDGGAHTTAGYMLDSVGGTVFPGQNSFPIHFGLINAANDLFESGVANGIEAYRFAGKGKAIDSDYIHTQDLHVMDSNSIFDSGRAYDMFLNERSGNKLTNFQYFDMMPINHKNKFSVDPSKRDSDHGPYPGNRISISPTQPSVFPIGFDSNAIAAGDGGGGGGAAADPESWS